MLLLFFFSAINQWIQFKFKKTIIQFKFKKTIIYYMYLKYHKLQIEETIQKTT